MTSKDITKSADGRNAILDEHVNAIRELGKRTISNIIEIGRHLVECKRIVGHGGWYSWLRCEFDWSRQTADNFINVFEASKTLNFSDLNLPVSAVYQLVRPSTPEPVRNEIVERSEAGEELALKTVKEAIAKAVEEKIAKATRARNTKASSTNSSEPVKTIPTAEPAPVDLPAAAETENAGLKHEIRRLQLAHADEVKHLKAQADYLAQQNFADRPMTLQAAIEQLIKIANLSTCFENVLPEDVVYTAKDLDRVINHLRSLNASMAKRRKAMKAKKSSPTVAVADDGLDIPADLRRAAPDPELTPDEIKAVIAAINRENNDTSWRLDSDGRGGVLMVGLDADGNVDGKPEKANLIELAGNFEIDLDQIRERASASIHIITQSVH